MAVKRNHSASTMALCVVCVKEVRPRQHAIQCDSCDQWQHRLCDTGIDITTYRQMTKGHLQMDFRCKRCVLPPPSPRSLSPFPSPSPLSPTLPLSPPSSPDATSPTSDSSFELTAATINAPDDVLEDSIADPDPQTLPDGQQTQQEWTILPTGSKRGKPLLVDNRGFSYTIQKTRSYAVYWWCSVRPKEGRCSASVSKRGEDFTRGASDHNHEPTTGLLTKATINVKIRDVAKSGEYFKSSGVMAEEIYRTESQPSRPCPSLPPLTQAARKINYHRQAERPSEPKDLDFEDYVAVFNAVNDLLDGTAVEKMVTDFEAATWKGFHRVFPDVRVKGCTFHMNQAIYRKVQNLGLTTAYDEDVGTNRFVKKLMGLQFLDAAHIKPAFLKLKQQAVTPGLVALCDYFSNTWIESSVWTVANWSVFGTTIRTNNDLESWHKRLNQRSGRRHLPFYRLVPLLYGEADLLPLQIRLVTDGQLERRQHTSQRKKTERFFNLWEEFQESRMTVSQLLREVSKLNGPMITE